jgi:hypothetical protein
MTVYGNPDASTVLIQMVDDHDLAVIDSEIAEIKRLSDADFSLFALKVGNWNTDLSPWDAPAVFGKEDFGHGAKASLARVLELAEDRNRTYIIGGYSLAGLFALWASCRTEVFSAVAAASPSVWFPGFTDFLKTNPSRAKAVYLSLGDKEENTRNPVMATVGDRIKETFDILKGQGVDTVFEWNQGNHFKDPDLRTAKAFAWTLSQIKNSIRFR